MDQRNEDYLNEVLNSEEYIENQMQIDTLKTILLKEYSVNEQILNWLISAIEKKSTLTIEAKYKK